MVQECVLDECLYCVLEGKPFVLRPYFQHYSLYLIKGFQSFPFKNIFYITFREIPKSLTLEESLDFLKIIFIFI